MTPSGRYDVVLLDQGYGGVWVHTVQLWKRLRARVRALVISPTDPLFEDLRDPDLLTLASIRRSNPGFTTAAFVTQVRELLSSLEVGLLLIMHRSQSVFVFDLVDRQPTVIYSDGHYEPRLGLGASLPLRWTNDQVLREIMFLLAAAPASAFLQLPASPATNLKVLAAGWRAMERATANWCWGAEQARVLARAVPSIARRTRFVPPFIDGGIFDSSLVDREKVVLFTSTMHNLDKKGLPELLAVMDAMPDLRVRCVVGQPHRFPEIADRFRGRLQVERLDRSQLRRVFHTAWVNCRISHEDNAPLSVLESMTCELPQVVSPAVAREIPLLENGQTGFIVDPDDRESLAQVMRQLLTDPALRNRMGRECRARALAYDFSRRTSEILDLVR